MARIKLRRDTSANWTAVNPILLEGEPGLELDTGRTKHGNGTSTWTQLPYNANTGYTGSAGIPGNVGIPGPTGFTGSSGVGFVGSQGFTGFTGSVGFTGSQGDIGFTGSQGDIGFTGSQGDIGFTGSAGGISYSVVNSGASAYTIAGAENPALTLVKGFTYYFDVSAPGHPFWIKTSAVTGTDSAYSSGVTNNGTESGIVAFSVPFNAPSTLYYICQYHGSMSGVLNIADLAGGSSTVGLVSDGTSTITVSSGFNLVPETDITQDIGSPTNRFRDLYLSNNTIILGDNALSVSATGELTVNGNNPTQSYVIFGEGNGAGRVQWKGAQLMVVDPNPDMAKALANLVAGNTVKSVGPQIFSLTITAPGAFTVIQEESFLPIYAISVAETRPSPGETYILNLAIPTQELIAVDNNGDLTKDGNPIGSTLTEFTSPNGAGSDFSTVMVMSDGRLTVKFNTPNPAFLSALQGLKPGNKFYINAPFKAIYTVASTLSLRVVEQDYFLLTTDYGFGADQTPPNIWESMVDNISIPVFNTPVAISDTAAVPTSSSSPGTAGQIIHSNGYIYICIKSGEWYRVTASTF
jgi:hypothetical protein